MRGAVMYGPGEVRVEEREAPQIVEPTDAIIRVSAACVCGSDLWPYRGIGVEDSAWPMPMGHEYVGIVEEVGDAVTTVKPGQFVVGSFWASRQHVRDLPRRLPERLREPGADGRARRAGRPAARPAGRRHADRHARTSRPTTWSRACWRPPTSWAPAGSAPSPPRPARARPSPSSATARSGCSRCWRPSSSAPSGSSP